MTQPTLQAFLDTVARRDPNQFEFQQAVREVMESLWPFIQKHPQYREHGLLERLVEPDRIVQFRVAWVDDAGHTRINRAWRVQHSAAIGPYKGGMRFHPSVNLSILKFLAFEQTFKNALTTLPMGGGRAARILIRKARRWRSHALLPGTDVRTASSSGPDTDVPASDIGVGARSRFHGRHDEKARQPCRLRVHRQRPGLRRQPDAAGGHRLGTVYFVEQMLHHACRQTHGARVLISGAAMSRNTRR